MISVIQMPREKGVRVHLTHAALFILNELKESHVSSFFFDSFGKLPTAAKEWMHKYGLTQDTEIRPPTVQRGLFWATVDYRSSCFLQLVNKKYSKYKQQTVNMIFAEYQTVGFPKLALADKTPERAIYSQHLTRFFSEKLASTVTVRAQSAPVYVNPPLPFNEARH